MTTRKPNPKTLTRPRGWKELAGSGGAGYDPEKVQPATRGEVYPLFAAGVVLAFFALMVCYRRGYLLLYGDAVAHLAIARRILDSRYPGIAQLGGVWLPLPHLLILPFIRNMTMWQTGLAAAPMSMVSYALSVAGLWRLGRRLMRLRWAFAATAFYALNANLLFLSTTAMTEALFLALLIWSVLATMEGVAALRNGRIGVARGQMIFAGLLIIGMVFTRYDGWIVGAAEWACVAWAMWQANAEVRKKTLTVFLIFTLMCAAGPLAWFWYNQHFEHDWLDFMRGPYSAEAIDRKTSPMGQHYREWHNPWRSLKFYMRCAQIDAAAWETGWLLMAAALYGAWIAWKRRVQTDVSARAESFALLLWLPLPFYIYAVAYGSVPIFIPQLYPHSYYNARYGMELLPALAVYAVLAAERLELWLRGEKSGWGKLGARFWQPAVLLLCVANCLAMMYAVPLVLKEGMVNSTTRVALEKQIAFVLETMPTNVPVMMTLGSHVGAVQRSGRTLVSMVSENDSESFDKALADPAGNAAFVIAIEGDAVAQAVAAHPLGLQELYVMCTTGQPCAKVYQSTVWKP
jgi:hypothetical protein